MKCVQTCMALCLMMSLAVTQSLAAPLIDAIGRGDLPGVVANANAEAINEKDEMGSSPLHEAAYRGCADVTKFLIDKGAEVKVKNNAGLTPLHYAAMNYFSRHANLDIAVMLIEKGADVNAKDSSGNTPLHTPALNCNYEMVRLLIEKGADVNAKNDEGETALHVTSGNGSFECVNLLYDNGADVTAKTKEGKTAGDLARKNGHTELADALDKVMKEKP